MSTVFARATAPGRAGVAVLRISGPNARAVVALCGTLPAPREARLRRLRADGDVLDDALVLWFPGPSSYTGEDMVELHCHGSAAVIAAVEMALLRIPGIERALPGDFTRRALENGRLDLPQVEALADLIDAETEAQRRQAQRLLDGALGATVASWRARLVTISASIMAAVDFADQDVPDDALTTLCDDLGRLTEELTAEIANGKSAERIRDGFEVAIVGAPNVGKSTLLNRIAGREAAIVTDVPGTTRDLVQVAIDLHGLPVTFIDTAGLRETDDTVESAGILRTRDAAAGADLRIFLGAPDPSLRLDAEDVCVGPKADLSGHGVSGKTGQGVECLLAQVTRVLESRTSLLGVAVRRRHREGLQRAVAALLTARQCAEECELDVAGAMVETALRCLDAVVGQVDVEEVLDDVFARFCLGK